MTESSTPPREELDWLARRERLDALPLNLEPGIGAHLEHNISAPSQG